MHAKVRHSRAAPHRVQRQRVAPIPDTRIALDCGFCDQATFCRQFKSVTGTTPMAYRRFKAVS